MTSIDEPAWAGGPTYSGAQAAHLPPESDPDGGTRQVAKAEAATVAQSASGAAQQVAGTAKEQAASVASDAQDHARNLVGEARDQVSTQAGAQRDRAVSGLRSLGDELHSLAAGSGGTSGVATQLARQAGDATHQVAGYLEGRDPRDLLDELSALARRRPGAFLLGAAVAGVAAGRLTRGITGGNSPRSTPAPVRSPSPAPAIDMPVVPASSAPTYAEADTTFLESVTGGPTSGYTTQGADPNGSSVHEHGSGTVIS